MDPVTHALTGAVLGEAGFRTRLGPRAVAFGALVAAWPDADMFFMAVPGLGALLPHRGLTHAWLAWLLLSPLIGYAGWRWNRRRAARDDARHPPDPDAPPRSEATPGPGGWIALATLAYASHIGLDLTNSYGTMVWMPFSDTRATLDAMPILDVVLSGTLAAVWLLARLLHRRDAKDAARKASPVAATSTPAPVDAPDGTGAGSFAKKDKPSSDPFVLPGESTRARYARLLSWAALVAMALYIRQGVLLRDTVTAAARAECRIEGIAASEVRVFPLMATNRLWRVYVHDAEHDRVGFALHSTRAPRPLDFRWYPSFTPAQRAAALENREVRRFLRFVGGVYSVESDAGAPDVLRLVDRRHGMLSSPDLARYGLTVRFENSRVVETWPHRPDMDFGLDPVGEARLTWRLFRYGEPPFHFAEDRSAAIPPPSRPGPDPGKSRRRCLTTPPPPRPCAR